MRPPPLLARARLEVAPRPRLPRAATEGTERRQWDALGIAPPRLGVMLRPRGGATVFSDSSALSVRIKVALGDTRGLFAPSTTLKIGSPELEAVLDRETASVARHGNRVTLCPDGVSSFAARDRIFAAATDGEVVHQQTFVHREDATGWKNAQQMQAHARKGIARHIYDGIGSRDFFGEKKIFGAMRDSGVALAEVGSRTIDLVTRGNMLNHQKFLLLGNRMGLIGGCNIGDMYALSGVRGSGLAGDASELRVIGWERPYKLIEWRGFWGFRKQVTTYRQPWHDVDFLVEGPAVADMQRAFMRSWAGRGDAIDPAQAAALQDPAAAPFYGDGCIVRYIDHRPYEDGDDHITAAFVRYMDAASSSIVIETPYFSPPPAIREAMKRAARRKVTVRVLTNSREAVNHKVAYDVGHGMYRELLAAGVVIYERTPMLHAKVMTVDDKVTLGGSANLNGRTRYCDAESLIVVTSDALALETRAVMETEIARSTQVTPAMLGGLGTYVRDKAWSLLRKMA